MRAEGNSRTDADGEKASSFRSIAPSDRPEAQERVGDDRSRALVENLVAELREFITHSGQRAAVIGVSGGVDSAVTAALATRAIGEDRVYAYFLPSRSTPIEDAEDARSVRQLLGLTHWVETPIDSIVDEFIRNDLELAKDRVALGNVKARVRMALLYSYANRLDGLVIGTGDRSEELLGYFTKYGDGGVDINPIGDLFKSEVRTLAKSLGLPARVWSKPPSPQLWEGHVAETELGFSYTTIDNILGRLLNDGLSVEALLSDGSVDPDAVHFVASRMAASRHKRETPPVILVREGNSGQAGAARAVSGASSTVEAK